MAPVDPASSAFELLVAVVLLVVLVLAVAAAALPYIQVSFDEPLRTVVAGTFVAVVDTCPLAVGLVVVAVVGRNSLHRFVVVVVVAGFRTHIPLVDAVP